MGCGAIVNGGLVVTCKHVWAQMPPENSDPKIGRMLAPFTRSGKTVELTLEWSLDRADVVFLRIGETLPNGHEEVPLSKKSGMPADGVIYTGINAVSATSNLLSDIQFETINCKILPESDPDGNFKITADSASEAYWLGKGNSGSPVFAKDGESLIGIVKQSVVGGPNSPRMGLIIPSSLFKSRYDEFLQSLAIQEQTSLKITGIIEDSRMTQGYMHKALGLQDD